MKKLSTTHGPKRRKHKRNNDSTLTTASEVFWFIFEDISQKKNGLNFISTEISNANKKSFMQLTFLRLISDV
jgi:hypothetical protein